MTPSPYVLAVATFLLGGLIAAELAFAPRAYPDAGSAVLAAKSPASPRTSPVRADLRDGWLDTVLARPLFNPDRRPLGATASVIPPRLTATLISPAVKRAIFASDGKPAIVVEGDRMSMWTVQTISNGVVTLIGANGPLELRVSFQQNPDQGAPTIKVATPHGRTHTRKAAG